MTKTIEIKGIECESGEDALGWADALGRGVVISVGNKVLVVDP